MEKVSIHAPVKERPSANLIFVFRFNVSIHAPVKERHIPDKWSGASTLVSIHAPVKERPDCFVNVGPTT